jgi:hypothetical protein
MLVLRTPPAARAGSPLRWATGAVIAAILLAEVPRAPDHTSARTPDRATDPAAEPRAACGSADGPPAPAGPIAPAASGSAGTSHRSPLRHVIGL